ncbi:hypothetical protein CYMTET_29557, partial [Cymbomonas tetramitiformis]
SSFALLKSYSSGGRVWRKRFSKGGHAVQAATCDPNAGYSRCFCGRCGGLNVVGDGDRLLLGLIPSTNLSVDQVSAVQLAVCGSAIYLEDCGHRSVTLQDFLQRGRTNLSAAARSHPCGNVTTSSVATTTVPATPPSSKGSPGQYDSPTLAGTPQVRRAASDGEPAAKRARMLEDQRRGREPRLTWKSECPPASETSTGDRRMGEPPPAAGAWVNLCR